jgi:succinoglycan biosynthesis transport protein ExoP
MNTDRDFNSLPMPVRRDASSRTGLIQESEVWARAGAAESDSSVVIEYARTFWNHRWLVALSIIGGCVIAFAGTLTSLPVFRAVTSVEIQGLNSEFMNMRAVDPTGQSGNSSDESFVQTQIKLLQSDSLITEVIKKLDTVGARKMPRQDLLTVWQQSMGKGSGGDLSRKAALRYIAENLKVKPMGVTRLVQISCDGWDARLAAEFCNTMAQQFIEDGLAERLSAAHTTSEWLTRQVEDVRGKLSDSESKYQQMQRENAVYSADRETIAQAHLRQLQDQVSVAESEKINKLTQFQLTTTAPPDSLPMVLDSGPLKDYQKQKTELGRQVAEKSPPLLPTHPEIIHLNAEIAQIDAAIERERSNIMARAKNEYDAASQRAQLLGDRFSDQQRIVAVQLEKNAQLQMLERDVLSNRKLYENLLERAKEAGFVTAMRASTVRVVDPAKPPLIPIAPRRTTTMVAGGAIAGFLSLMIALVKQRSDPRLRTPEDVKSQLRIREVGVIPSARADRRLRPSIWKRLRRPERGRLDLTTWTDRDSLVAESYRVAINSIFIAKRRSYKSAVLVVSSPSVGEGKTTAAANLAIALAETRKRVVIVDGDLRNPRLHKSLGVENDFGIRDLLRQDALAGKEDVDKAVKTTSVPGVFLLPSGSRGSEDSIGLLHSPSLSAIIKSLSTTYDVVLIDTPPMLNLADARVFCETADGAILVVRANSTTREMAVAAYDSFATVNTPVIGVILNDFDAGREAGYGYYKKYYEYYRPTGA